MRRVQWMDVQRNEEGGLDLIGLLRDVPEFDEHGQLLDALVRAQRYTIATDMWGRIEFAEVKDVMVPNTVGVPRYAVDASVWPSVPQRVPVYEERRI